MNLRDYLHFEKRTIKDLSDKAEVSAGHITGYINGRYNFSLRMAKIISAQTDGKVTVEELMRDNPLKVEKRTPRKQKDKI